MLPRLNRKRLFELHGWLGLNLGLLLFIVCFSGTWAVMSPEIDRFINPAMRVTPPDDADHSPLSWGEIVARIEEAHPGAIILALRAPANPREAASAVVAHSPSDQRLVYVDPYRGEVRGQSTLFNARSFFRIFHKQFYILDGPWWPHGRVFVCVFSLALLFSALTGLLFYKKWWLSLFRLRMARGRRVFWSDLHRSLGVWALLFSAMFGITGLWYLTAQVLEDIGVKEHDFLPAIDRGSYAERGHSLGLLPIDDAVAIAEEAFPSLRIESIFPATEPGRPITFIGQGSAKLVEPSANRVHLDPYSGEILDLRDARDLALGPRFVATVDPLHFGRFGGWATRLLWTLAGLAISSGILTGAWLWWRRTRAMGNGAFRKNRLCTLLSAAFTIGVLILSSVSATAFIGRQVKGPEKTRPAHLMGERSLGPWTIRAWQHLDPETGGTSAFSATFSEGSHPNFKGAVAGLEDGERAEDPVPGQRSHHRLFFPLEVPADADQQERTFRLEIEPWKGDLLEAEFPLVDPGAMPPGTRASLSPPPAPGVPFGVQFVTGGFLALTGGISVVWLFRIR